MSPGGPLARPGGNVPLDPEPLAPQPAATSPGWGAFPDAKLLEEPTSPCSPLPSQVVGSPQYQSLTVLPSGLSQQLLNQQNGGRGSPSCFGLEPRRGSEGVGTWNRCGILDSTLTL